MKSYFRNILSLLNACALFSFFCICASLRPVFAQQPTFSPANENVTFLNTEAIAAKKRYSEDLADLPSKYKKDLLKIYQERWENLQEKFDKKEIYTEPGAQQYLNAIVTEIVKANPVLKNEEIKCYFSRSGVPNAAYLGEGVIVVNMGLFSRLENESQAAFVLCHELSHLCLRHSENSIQKYVTTLNSEEVQKELRHIKNSEYGKRKDLENLLKGITFNTRRHGRDHESQADSMAVELMYHTRFDVRESLRALAILDSIDTDTLNTALVLQKLFNAKEYPFQKKWIAKEEGLLSGHAKLTVDSTLLDSLKTHPDCKKRIQILKPMVEKYFKVSSSKNLVNKNTFDELVFNFKYEMIVYAFASDEYTESLYYTLKLLEQYPKDPFLVTQTGKILNGFYDAQKNHTLGKVAALPSPFYQENYNLLLQFIQNLYKEDYASISYYFLKPYATQMANYAPFKKVFNYSSQIVNQ